MRRATVSLLPRAKWKLLDTSVKLLYLVATTSREFCFTYTLQIFGEFVSLVNSYQLPFGEEDSGTHHSQP